MQRFSGLTQRALIALSLSVFCLALSASPAHAATASIEIKDIKDSNTGDTAWMLTSSALVLMMTGPGLALFYSGLVRRKGP